MARAILKRFYYEDISALRMQRRPFYIREKNDELLYLKGQISVSPNPVVDHLIIQSDAMAIEKVEILDELGARIFEVRYEKGNRLSSIDVNHLTSGIYYLRIRLGDGTFKVNRFAKLN